MGIRPTLQLQFARTERLDPRITFTRASSATRFNKFGNLETVGANVAAFSHDFVTFAPRGVRSEPQRTNSLRNNTMQGAAAGSPGTLPTNWVNGDNSGIRQVVDLNVVRGINTIALNYNGTATAANEAGIQMEAATQVAASSGQVWTYSTFLQEVLQDAAVTGLHIDVIALDSSAVEISRVTTTVSAGAKTQLQRYQCTHTMPASTAYVLGRVRYAYSGTPTINYTLRIGIPQMEQGPEASSHILTTGTAVARAGDALGMFGTNFSSWFNPVEGTFVIDAATNAKYAGTQESVVMFAVSDGTSNEKITAFYRTNSGFTDASYDVSDGGVSQSGFNTNTNETTTRWGLSYKANDFAFAGRGAVLLTDSSGTLPTVDRMYIGASAAGFNQLRGPIASITYYPVRLTNTQDVELST